MIIAGSRSLTDPTLVKQAVSASGFEITTVLSGCAPGIDRLGAAWAEAHGIPVEPHPADWKTHGKAAGFIRNEEMAACADALILVWDGKSRGSANMLHHAERLGLKIHVHRPPERYARVR